MVAIVRASHPISFQLLNSDRHPLLGIFDAQQGQKLTLEVTNTSRRDIKPRQLAEVPTADNHHFELRFRPGTLLLDNRPVVSVDEAGWKISPPDKNEKGVSFYLLIAQPVAIKEGKSISVTLNNLSGDGKHGGHGTRVELKWKQDSFDYVVDAGQVPEPLVPGHRIQYINVVNQGGQKHIPLHVGIVGNNKVLNNGSATALTLHITNLLKEGTIQLNPKRADNTPPPPSEFIFSFDAADDDWALGKPGQVKAITFSASDFNPPAPETLGQSVAWKMWPQKAITLEAGEFIKINIGNIITNHPPGATKLHVHYKNIPGYWDGDFVVRLEKAPLVYGPNGVGILMNPQVALDVNGKIRAGTVGASGNVGAGTPDPQDRLHVVGDVLLSKIPAQIKCGDDKHRIVFGTGDLEIRDSGPIVFSPGSNGATKTSTTVMLGDGRVGMGPTIPDTHLHVAGGGDQAIMIQSTDTNGGKWSLQASTTAGRFHILNNNDATKKYFTILKDGNVGIGATDPKWKLQVDGDVRASGSVRVGEDKELVLENKGRIKCFDNNHVIEFRRDFQMATSELEIRERGKILFSPGAEQGVGTNKVVILSNGKVGIGVVDPDKAMLQVAGWANTTVNGYYYMNATGSPAHTGKETRTITEKYSIWAEKRVAAEEFNAVSDARLKSIQGRSDGAADLATLLGIEITDYSFRDVIGKGAGAYKKVIGQQVDKVFPQAVNKQTDVVPDIYQQASISDGWVALATDLKKGDRVKLIREKGEGVHEVLEVMEDKFRVAFDHEDDKVFVFGREVDDLCVVDYDAIAMLNVSATQQLKKEMDQELKALRVENAELRAANDALAKRLQLLESRLESALGVVSAHTSSNGNGRH